MSYKAEKTIKESITELSLMDDGKRERWREKSAGIPSVAHFHKHVREKGSQIDIKGKVERARESVWSAFADIMA